MANEGLTLVQMRPGHTNRLQLIFRKFLWGQKHTLSCMSRNRDSLTYLEIRYLTSWTGGDLCGEYKGVPIALLEHKIMQNKTNLTNAGVRPKNSWKTYQMVSKHLFGIKGDRKYNPQCIHQLKNIHLHVCQGIAIP